MPGRPGPVGVSEAGRVAQGRAIVRSPHHTNTGKTGQHTRWGVEQDRGQVLLGLVDLVVQQIQNGQVGGENRCPTCPFDSRQAQRIRGGLVKLLGLTPLQPHSSAGSERLQALDAEPVQPPRIGKVMQQDRPDLAAKQIVKAAVQAREDQVQRPEQLIGQRGPSLDPTTAHPGPDQLLDQGVTALLWRPSTSVDDQVDDRRSVTKIGLEPAGTLLGTSRFDMSWVELDNIMAASNQSGHHGAVVMPSGLDPDPHRDRAAGLGSRRQHRLQRPDSRLSQRERQRLPDDLTSMISDQTQSLVLPDIDPRRKTTRRVQPPSQLHVLLL